jgi:hypothetical protein
MSRGPRLAAWALGALTAVALAGSVYRVPIQVSDSLEVIERVIPMPSAAAAFVDGLHNSPTMLRPLKEVRARLLVQAGEALGGRYHLVFRGYHALAGALLIALLRVGVPSTLVDRCGCAGRGARRPHRHAHLRRSLP